MNSFGENIYTPSFYERYKDIILSSGEGADELDLANFIISIDAILDFDFYEELKKINCTVFVLGSGEDRVLGRDASIEMAQKLGCDYYIYEGYGHASYDEAPDYLDRVKGFLDGIQ